MLALGQGSQVVTTQGALLFAQLLPETHLHLQVDIGNKTADLGGDLNTAVFLTLF